MQKITAHIYKLVQEWGMHPWDINNGDCCDFASALSVRLTKEGIRHEICFPDDNEDSPGHDWIESGGKCYDAETPHGVSHYSQLAIFLRHEDAKRKRHGEVA